MEPMSSDLNLSWRTCILIMLTSIVLTTPDWALATSTSGLPMEDVFCTATLWITGPVGRAIAMICMGIVGIGAILGKITWGVAMLIGVNVATVFGAANVVDALASGAPMNQCDASIRTNPLIVRIR
jgi:type IV secretion system protein VirB2